MCHPVGPKVYRATTPRGGCDTIATSCPAPCAFGEDTPSPISSRPSIFMPGLDAPKFVGGVQRDTGAPLLRVQPAPRCLAPALAGASIAGFILGVSRAGYVEIVAGAESRALRLCFRPSDVSFSNRCLAGLCQLSSAQRLAVIFFVVVQFVNRH